ncbi:MAG: branched-chain amino acid ABC transporter permease [Desulfobacteraceae bacterium]|nr:MAG: branched-chain amino acid ABC transporter permease [Desulfobacteraceae bacterium]
MMNTSISTPGKRATGSPVKVICLAAAFIALALLPFFWDNRFYISLITEIMIYGLLAMSLDVLLGYTGLLSFMHNAYLGIGAYVVGLFLIHVSPTSFWMACAAGIIFTAVVALPVGWVQVRTGGLAFALLTLAFGMMFYTIVWKWYGVTGGDDGLMGVPSPDITLFGWTLGNTGKPAHMYLLTLGVVTLSFLLTYRIIKSPFGAVLEAIRENEERAAFVGINVRRFKLIGWLLACCLAGMAGALFIVYKGYIGPTSMSAFAGAGVLMMVLVGGMGTLWGPIIGAGIFIYIQDYISTMTEHWEIFLGLVVIFLVLFMPAGFAGLGSIFKRLRRK